MMFYTTTGDIVVSCCLKALCVALAACMPLATWAEPFPPGEGVVFDGQTAYSVPCEALALGANALTVAAWVKVTDTAESQVFVNRGRADELFTFYLYRDGIRMLVSHNPGSYTKAVAPKPDANVWTHYAGAYDGQTIKVFRNGLLADTADAPGQINNARDAILFGALDDHQRFLNGAMDDIRIWRRVLTEAEVAAVAAGQSGGTLDDGLAGWWTPDGFNGTEWRGQGATATPVEKAERIANSKEDGYRGIWYYNQPSDDEYVYKYSGGLGTYCAKHIPHAWYSKEVNKTFFTYGGTRKGANTALIHMVSYFDHATGQVPRPTFLLDKQTTDAHDNPVINVDDKGYIWIFSSSHGTSRPSYISRSKEPYSIDAFQLMWTGNFSYPQPWYFPGKGFLFLHTFYTQGRTMAMWTSPDGVNWTDRRLLARIAKGHYQISRPFGHEKIGTAFNYHPADRGLNWRTNLYYMESSDFGATWQNVQGETLAPMLTAVDTPALVHDYEREKLNVYMKDINYDAKGNPVVLYVTSKGYESGPDNMPRTWTTARWTGSAWEIEGGHIVSDNNYDTGSIYIEDANAWRIIGPTEVGPQPYNPGGEVAMWVSNDQGKHWKMARKMTRNSDYNHTYVRRPVNAHPDFYAFWADGHGRQPSESRLYFCNHGGDVFRLPTTMSEDFAKPEKVN